MTVTPGQQVQLDVIVASLTVRFRLLIAERRPGQQPATLGTYDFVSATNQTIFVTPSLAADALYYRIVQNRSAGIYQEVSAQIIVLSQRELAPMVQSVVVNTCQNDSGAYRYGYQGQTREDHFSGVGDFYSYRFRWNDTRIGRFLSTDPLQSKYPWNSSYAFSENRVISAIELEGLEAVDLNTGKTDNTLSGDNLKGAIKSNKDYSPWQDLITHKIPDNLFDASGGRVLGLNRQPIEEAYSDELNLDYYSINITKLPKGHNLPNEFLSYVRSNLDYFCANGGASFGGLTSTEEEIFSSSNPAGSVMQFSLDNNLDDMSVTTLSLIFGYLPLYLRLWT
jgi:RHS repeat-associated protein